MNVKRGATPHLRKGWGAMEGALGPEARSDVRFVRPEPFLRLMI